MFQNTVYIQATIYMVQIIFEVDNKHTKKGQSWGQYGHLTFTFSQLWSNLKTDKAWK